MNDICAGGSLKKKKKNIGTWWAPFGPNQRPARGEENMDTHVPFLALQLRLAFLMPEKSCNATVCRNASPLDRGCPAAGSNGKIAKLTGPPARSLLRQFACPGGMYIHSTYTVCSHTPETGRRLRCNVMYVLCQGRARGLANHPDRCNDPRASRKRERPAFRILPRANVSRARAQSPKHRDPLCLATRLRGFGGKKIKTKIQKRKKCETRRSFFQNDGLACALTRRGAWGPFQFGRVGIPIDQ